MEDLTTSIIITILLLPMLLWTSQALSYAPQDPESRSDFLRIALSLFVFNYLVNLLVSAFFDFYLWLQLLLALALIIPARIYWIWPSPKHKPTLRSGHDVLQLHLLAVLGSGGHTGEMISILRGIDITKYKQRTYIVSSGDPFSAKRALQFENEMTFEQYGLNQDNEESDDSEAKEDSPEPEASYLESLRNPDPVTGQWVVETVPRARKIHQRLHTTPFSSLYCLLGCLKSLVYASYLASDSHNPFALAFPDIIVTNGPATGIIVVLASFVLKFIGLAPRYKMKVIYIESFARIRSLSLSGKILLKSGICDRFFVQWKKLQDILSEHGYTNVEYEGFLVK